MKKGGIEMRFSVEVGINQIIEETIRRVRELNRIVPDDEDGIGRYRVCVAGEDPINVIRYNTVVKTIGKGGFAKDGDVDLLPPRAVDCLNALNVKFELALAGGNPYEGRLNPN